MRIKTIEEHAEDIQQENCFGFTSYETDSVINELAEARHKIASLNVILELIYVQAMEAGDEIDAMRLTDDLDSEGTQYFKEKRSED